MNRTSSYETYLRCLKEIREQAAKENSSQGDFEEQERNTVSQIELQYRAVTEELDTAYRAVKEQYRSVWESCTQLAGLRCPQEQRPESTSLSWKNAIRLQEIAATRIQNWMAQKSQEAAIEKQKQLLREAARKREMELAAAEEARRQAEEASREEQRKAEALVEEMKRRYKKRK